MSTLTVKTSSKEGEKEEKLWEKSKRERRQKSKKVRVGIMTGKLRGRGKTGRKKRKEAKDNDIKGGS